MSLAMNKSEAWKRLALTFRKNFVFPTNANINWFPGHMTKGLKMMEKTLIETDLVSFKPFFCTLMNNFWNVC